MTSHPTDYSDPDIPQRMKKGEGYWYRGDFYPGKTETQGQAEATGAWRVGIKAEDDSFYRKRLAR